MCVYTSTHLYTYAHSYKHTYIYAFTHTRAYLQYVISLRYGFQNCLAFPHDLFSLSDAILTAITVAVLTAVGSSQALFLSSRCKACPLCSHNPCQAFAVNRTWFPQPPTHPSH